MVTAGRCLDLGLCPPASLSEGTRGPSRHGHPVLMALEVEGEQIPGKEVMPGVKGSWPSSGAVR